MTYLETKRYELQCLSPVHVGSGEVVKPVEYLFDRKRQRIYFLNEKRWITFLHQYQLMEPFVEYIKRTSYLLKRRGPFQGELPWDWLLRQGIKEDVLDSLALSCAQVIRGNRVLDIRSVNDISRQVKTATGKVYIPGSTIKGALRTGIVSHIIRKNQGEYKKYWEAIKEIITDERRRGYNGGRDFKEKLNKKMSALEATIFEKLHLEGQKGMSCSVLRGLHVSDAVSDVAYNTVILQKLDVTAGGKSEKKLPLFRECIPIGAKLHFTVSMDKAMLNEIGVSSIDELFSWYRCYMNEGLALQREVFYNTHKRAFALADEADLLLGGGTGFLSKTVFYNLAPTQEAGRKMLAILLDIIFQKGRRPAHKHAEMDTKISPRTLKMACVNGTATMLGLCRVREVPVC